MAQLGDQFGLAVAINGETVAVGGWADDDLGSSSGAVYIFHRVGNTWTQQAKLTASDGAADDRFGYAVDIEGDTVAVGAPGDDDLGSFSGSVYIFQRNRAGWTEHAKLTASDGAANDSFGEFAVEIDQDKLVVSAHNDNAPDTNSGSAYVFQRTGRANWIELAKLTGSDGAAHDLFGLAVDIDGDVIVAGALGGDDLGLDSGSAYVFELVPYP